MALSQQGIRAGGEGLRSPAARALIAAALTLALALGAAFLAVDRRHSSVADAVEHPGRPATDEQTMAEVVEQAKSLVAVARLALVSAGYLLMSCKNRDDPPYQGAVYVNFTLPADAGGDTYFQAVAAAMAARGWREGLPPNQYLYGRTLSKNGVTAIIYQDNDSPGRGVARIYGQCRDVTGHRGNSTGWVDITDEVR